MLAQFVHLKLAVPAPQVLLAAQLDNVQLSHLAMSTWLLLTGSPTQLLEDNVHFPSVVPQSLTPTAISSGPLPPRHGMLQEDSEPTLSEQPVPDTKSVTRPLLSPQLLPL